MHNIEAKITNISLLRDRFQVSAIINGNQEDGFFMPDVVAQDILNWLEDRKFYYQSLLTKQEQLKETFINEDLWQQ